jgi:hypothetical protein
MAESMGHTRADLMNPAVAFRVERALMRERQTEATSTIEEAVVEAARELGIDPAAARYHGEARKRCFLEAARRRPKLFGR